MDEPPTLPLTKRQYEKLLEVTPNEFPAPKAIRVRALIRLIRHSGLAIRDSVTLERTELHKSKKGVYRVVTNRQKTGTHVSVPIPPDVGADVEAVMKFDESKKFIFCHIVAKYVASTCLDGLVLNGNEPRYSY